MLAWLPPGDSSCRLARSGGASAATPCARPARRPRLCRLSHLLTARWNADADVWLCFAALLGAWSCPGLEWPSWFVPSPAVLCVRAGGCPGPWALLDSVSRDRQMLFPQQVKNQPCQASRAPHELSISRRTTFRVHTRGSCQPPAEDLVRTEELRAAELQSKVWLVGGLCFSFTGFPGSFRASLHTFTSVTPSCVNKTVKSEQVALRGPTACDEAAKQKVWKACPENKGCYL